MIKLALQLAQMASITNTTNKSKLNETNHHNVETKKSVKNPTESTNTLFTIKKIKNKGRGVIATSHIKKGTIILREKPLITIPSDSDGLYYCAN